MTSAEARTLDATVEEFQDALEASLIDAENAGIDKQVIARALLVQGIGYAIAHAAPINAIHDIDAYLLFLSRKVKDKLAGVAVEAQREGER